MKIFIASLPFKMEEKDIKETFEEYGEVSSVKLVLDKDSGKKKGYGFVEMSDDEQAKKAIQELNGLEIMGRTIAVTEAEDKGRGNSRKGGSSGSRNFQGRDNNYRSFDKDY